MHLFSIIISSRSYVVDGNASKLYNKQRCKPRLKPFYPVPVLTACQRCPLEALSVDVCVTLHFLLCIVCDSLSCEESASLTSLMSVYKRRSSRHKHTCLPSNGNAHFESPVIWRDYIHEKNAVCKKMASC